jgi:hypothetical protein
MASIRDTIVKTIMGNKRVHFGEASLLNATTSGTIATGLRKVESFQMNSCMKYTVSAGVVTATFADPTATKVQGWMAIGY